MDMYVGGRERERERGKARNFAIFV